MLRPGCVPWSSHNKYRHNAIGNQQFFSLSNMGHVVAAVLSRAQLWEISWVWFTTECPTVLTHRQHVKPQPVSRGTRHIIFSDLTYCIKISRLRFFLNLLSKNAVKNFASSDWIRIRNFFPNPELFVSVPDLAIKKIENNFLASNTSYHNNSEI